MTSETSALALKFDLAVSMLEEFTFTNFNAEGDQAYEERRAELLGAVTLAFDQIEALPAIDLDNLRLQARCALWADPDLAIIAGESMAARMNRAIVTGLLGLRP